MTEFSGGEIDSTSSPLPLIDQLNGGIPEWFTDEHWVQLAIEYREATEQIDVLSPEYAQLEAKYRAGLGTTHTNNLWVWFLSKPPLDETKDDYGMRAIYNLDAAVHDDTPGVPELRAVRSLHPDLFAEVQLLCDQHSTLHHAIIDNINNRQTTSAKELIESTISLFKMRMGIEKVLSHLREMGVSEDTIGMLGR